MYRQFSQRGGASLEPVHFHHFLSTASPVAWPLLLVCADSRVLIVRSSKKCGISNALDGTEDCALFEDSDKEISDDDSE